MYTAFNIVLQLVSFLMELFLVFWFFFCIGFIPPTSGTAQVNGCDIRDDIQGVRKSLGLCPQHNILFDSLTVKEHLMFFAKVRER